MDGGLAGRDRGLVRTALRRETLSVTRANTTLKAMRRQPVTFVLFNPPSSVKPSFST
jgi:hypothetical protein